MKMNKGDFVEILRNLITIFQKSKTILSKKQLFGRRHRYNEDRRFSYRQQGETGREICEKEKDEFRKTNHGIRR